MRSTYSHAALPSYCTIDNNQQEQQTTAYGSIDDGHRRPHLLNHYPSTTIGSEESRLIEPTKISREDDGFDDSITDQKMSNNGHQYHVCHSCGKPNGCNNRSSENVDEEGGKKINVEEGEDPTLHLHCRTRTTFWNDLKNKEGTIPHSLIVGLCVGIACGIAVFLYYKALFGLMDWWWKNLPQQLVVDKWPQQLQVLWIPLVLVIIAIGIGLTVQIMGDPGDLAYTIKCVHSTGYITIDHAIPMVFASLFSIGK